MSDIESGFSTDSESGTDRLLALRVVLLLAVSIGFESLFIGYGLNAMDEGWPLHAAMEMHDGKDLYGEVFWVFPPGHALPAWIGYGIAPPGLIGTRIIYATFNVALCLGLFFVARRFMPPDFALLAGLLVAIAAPQSHWEHLLFGYRYLVWSVIVLLLFRWRLTRDDSRWLLLAGVFAGIQLFFRLTPAFAVSVAVGVGIVAASRDWRRWLTDGLWYGAGIVVVWIPVLLWFSQTVGLPRLWSEMVMRPVEMTALQSIPIPPLVWPDFTREQISTAFASLGFRLYPLLYLSLLVVLSVRWVRAVWTRRSFDQAFLLSFVVFGAIYFARSLGRSDIPHLDSAIPPVAVLIAYCASLSTRASGFRTDVVGRKATFRRTALCVGVFGLWAFLNNADAYLALQERMGRFRLESTPEWIKVGARSYGRFHDVLVPTIQTHAKPDETILVMANSPILYVLADRHSPGYYDLVMPGTFRNPDEESAYLERVKEAAPAVIVWPLRHFDNMPSRGLQASAPLLSRWILDHYRPIAGTPLHSLMVPKRDNQEEGRSDSLPPD